MEDSAEKILGIQLTADEEISEETLNEFDNGKGEDNE